MLSGVYFTKHTGAAHGVRPEFVNQYILTDIWLWSTSIQNLRRPILPSISTLINPLSSLLKLSLVILRAVLLVVLSRLPGSSHTIKKISVGNTSVLYHDGRALATCESGPPMRVQLPSLQTVGWYNGQYAEGEPERTTMSDKQVLGGDGVLSFMREWTTAHPKVDPKTGEMLMFHCTPLPPYVHYTIIPTESASAPSTRMNMPLPGITSAKMMHDFGVSHEHTVILDLPLSLDALQLAKGKPIINYDSSIPSRFGIFPRNEPSEVRWFETLACCIFHTANTWDAYDSQGNLESVNLLACRLTSAAMVFTAGNVQGPQPTRSTVQSVARAWSRKQKRRGSFEESPLLESANKKHYFAPAREEKNQAFNLADEEDDQCRLYYYCFNMSNARNTITHQFALSPIPFEFPSTHPALSMQAATYIYGCTSTVTSFNPSLGRAARIDCLVKFNAPSLIARGKENPPSLVQCVDRRIVAEVLAEQNARGGRCEGDVQVFRCPNNVFAQEPRFVPREKPTSEDDGYLVFYTFDEDQIDDVTGDVKEGAASELWIVDAKNMVEVVGKVKLPQRVPYGLHGNWFSEDDIRRQRAVQHVREIPKPKQLRFRERLGRRLINSAVCAIGG